MLSQTRSVAARGSSAGSSRAAAPRGAAFALRRAAAAAAAAAPSPVVQGAADLAPAAAAPRPAAQRRGLRRAVVAAAAPAGRPTKPTAALIFDCDGVIVETEELHRRAYNAAFEAFGLTVKGAPCEWPTKYYDLLQNTVAGGKGKMRYHFDNNGWEIATKDGGVAEAERDALIDALQVCARGRACAVLCCV